MWSTRSPSPTRPARRHTRCRKHNTHLSKGCLLCSKRVTSCNIRKQLFYMKLPSVPFFRGMITSFNQSIHKYHYSHGLHNISVNDRLIRTMVVPEDHMGAKNFYCLAMSCHNIIAQHISHVFEVMLVFASHTEV